MKQANRSPPFYALNDDLPLILAISSGLQHALAMLGRPHHAAHYIRLGTQSGRRNVLLHDFSVADRLWCVEHQNPLRKAKQLTKLIPGILSLVQMSRIHLFRGYYLGTGLITVVGTSFATLSTATAVRFSALLFLSLQFEF